MPPYNLFGLEGQDYSKAKVVAIPVPYDSTTTYRAGTRDGPRAIIEASRNIELYSDETNEEISRIGIYTTEEIAPDLSSPENMVKRIENEVKPIVNDGKVPLLIGGEHTISIGNVRALSGAGKKFTYLHFDAHSDSRDNLMNSRFCHGCVIARVRELCDFYSVGVRSIDKESASKYNDKILYMKDMHKLGLDEIAKSILQKTDENVYLSIDFDVLNPSEMPSVGTPEPDGISFYHMKEILREVLARKNLVGMDFVELSPIPALTAPNYLAAKLIYLAISYAFGRR